MTSPDALSVYQMPRTWENIRAGIIEFRYYTGEQGQTVTVLLDEEMIAEVARKALSRQSGRARMGALTARVNRQEQTRGGDE